MILLAACCAIAVAAAVQRASTSVSVLLPMGRVFYLTHSGPEALLCHMGERFKHRIMVTNAHQKLLDVKLARTGIGVHFDAVISAHELGLPKKVALEFPSIGSIAALLSAGVAPV